MTHPPYLIYEDMLRDEECWDESIKEKYNQQSLVSVKVKVEPIMKEEALDEDDQLTSSESKERSMVIQLNTLDVNVFLVDCRQYRSSSTKKTSKKHQCNVCDKCFNEPRDLKRHLMVHSGEKPHVCSHCGRSFTQKGNLDIHVRVHTHERPYSCDVCDFTCSTKTNLTKHMVTHTGDKPYTCSHCDYTCSRKHHLTRHIRTHTGERPHSCSHCNYTCSVKHHLTRHLRRHKEE